MGGARVGDLARHAELLSEHRPVVRLAEDPPWRCIHEGGEPRLRKVVYPGGWDKDATLPSEPPKPPDVQELEEFFGPLIAEVARTRIFRPRPYQRFGHAGRYFRSSRNQGLSYAVALEGMNNAWVTLHIETHDKELTKHIFDALNTKRSQIESTIRIDPESEWSWRRYDRWGFSSINMRKDGSISDPPQEQHDTRMWMLDLLAKFQEAASWPRRSVRLRRGLPPAAGPLSPSNGTPSTALRPPG